MRASKSLPVRGNSLGCHGNIVRRSTSDGTGLSKPFLRLEELVKGKGLLKDRGSGVPFELLLGLLRFLCPPPEIKFTNLFFSCCSHFSCLLINASSERLSSSEVLPSDLSGISVGTSGVTLNPGEMFFSTFLHRGVMISLYSGFSGLRV